MTNKGVYGLYGAVRADHVRLTEKLTVLYLMTETTVEERPSFSIISVLFRESEVLDAEYIPDISSEQKTAERVYDKFRKNGALPSNLYDCAETLLFV